MKVTRAASIPLVTHDPYFSIWSGADHLYDKDPVHWSQIRQQLRGYVNVDGVVYSFLGDKDLDFLKRKNHPECEVYFPFASG